jgi:hypothetical protein
MLAAIISMYAGRTYPQGTTLSLSDFMPWWTPKPPPDPDDE